MNQLQRYVDRYGPLAGPKLYHALQSRAAYIGSSRRRGREIEGLTGKPLGPYRPRLVAAKVEESPKPFGITSAPSLFD